MKTRCRNYALTLIVTLASLSSASAQSAQTPHNPFIVPLNEPVAFSEITASDVSAYASIIVDRTVASVEAIRSADPATFDNVVEAFDELYADLLEASSIGWVLFWVSPDSATRAEGLAANRMLDSLSAVLYSDRAIFDRVLSVSQAGGLGAPESRVVDLLLTDMRLNGVDLDPDALERFRSLKRDVIDLTAEYSTNMNSDVPLLTLDDEGVEGLPEITKSRYQTEQGTYEIPVIYANREPVLNNAQAEETRKAFYTAYDNRAVGTNLPILDSLAAKRYQLAKILGYSSYADYALVSNMAQRPQRVWDFLNDLIERTRGKAESDLALYKTQRAALNGTPMDAPLNPWDLRYIKTSIEKSEFGVDAEEVRQYLPLNAALSGMMEIYQKLVGLEFRRVTNPSVWDEEVELYDVYEDGELAGRFYLDLFPRPNKESWFYGVTMTRGSERPDGYEVPVGMMLANFPRPTDDTPALISHYELLILFHEFGHVLQRMSYKGRYVLLGKSQNDFAEAMSQIFESWIWDYDALKGFARHYQTGEVLPREIFDRMLAARKLGSGLTAQYGLERAVYDMMLYNRYDPVSPMPTDDIWRAIRDRFVLSGFSEGTHPQASWIHVNTHPVYYYGYIWSDVYAKDMFTQFEANGLMDSETGVRYRKLILANGMQRPTDEAVEEFLGRPMNNEAYIRSLGLEDGGAK